MIIDKSEALKREVLEFIKTAEDGIPTTVVAWHFRPNHVFNDVLRAIAHLSLDEKVSFYRIEFPKDIIEQFPNIPSHILYVKGN